MNQASIIGLTALLGILPVPSSVDVPLFISCTALIGLPHGAIDHIIFLHGQSLSTTKTTFEQFTEQAWRDSSFWARFLALYVGVIVAYGLLWVEFPHLSLAVFLMLSAYHFGQSQLFYINIPEESLLKSAVYIAWGNAVLLQILLLHFEETRSLLITFLDIQNVIAPSNAHSLVVLGTTVAVVALFALRLVNTSCISVGDLSVEILGLISLYVLSRYKSLLFSFILFYGLWHSLKSMKVQREELGISTRSYVLHALPFGLMSIIGISVILTLSHRFHSPFLMFFICLSVLAAPHMVVGQWMYSMRALSGSWQTLSPGSRRTLMKHCTV